MYILKLCMHRLITACSFFFFQNTKLYTLDVSESDWDVHRVAYCCLDLLVVSFQLLSTAEEVAILRTELESMQPQLKKAQEDTEEMIVQIEKDTVLSEATPSCMFCLKSVLI